MCLLSTCDNKFYAQNCNQFCEDTVNIPVSMYLKCYMYFEYLCIVTGAQNRRTAVGLAMELFEQHQGTHILQVSWT